MSLIKYNTQTVIEEINKLNFSGNIIPHTWFSHITFDNGKPDLLGIMILSEIIYWYRPQVIKKEYTGELVGYVKKFKADKFQRNASAFATQFGVSKRQAADALKRLEEQGLISRELRTLDTLAGRIGNVLYITPIVEKISEIQSQVPLIQSNVIGGNDHDEIEVEEIDEREPLGNQTYEGSHSNVIGMTSECGTYTENTTQNTTKITAAAPIENSDKTKLQYAAAANNKTAVSKCHNALLDVLPMAEPLIVSELTLTQQHKVKVAVQLLKLEMTIDDPERLIEEICHGLLDPNCFSKTGNNFHRKLKAISNSIRNYTWEKPASLAEKNKKQHMTEICKIRQALALAQSQVNYCNEMLAYSKTYPQLNIHLEKLAREKLQHEATVAEFKETLSKLILQQSKGV